MKTFSIVITNIPKEKEKEVIEEIANIVKKGLINLHDVHIRDA
jgi:hypothetical protein